MAVRSALEIEIRQGTSADLPAISQIQAASPEAAQWDVQDYAQYDLLIALRGETVAGFAVSRQVAEGESELLNLAVKPEFRRQGIARRLLQVLTARHSGTLWLEVRVSNIAGRNLYQSLGF